MQQIDMFEETLAKKIHRMEKWVMRIQKEIWFLKQVNELTNQKKQRNGPVFSQEDMFGT